MLLRSIRSKQKVLSLVFLYVVAWIAVSQNLVSVNRAKGRMATLKLPEVAPRKNMFDSEPKIRNHSGNKLAASIPLGVEPKHFKPYHGLGIELKSIGNVVNTTTVSTICASTKLGCYDVQSQKHAAILQNYNISTILCLSTCNTKNLPFVAIENGNTCKCYPTLRNIEELLIPKHSCNIPCKGNMQETCGGNNVANLYFIKEKCIKEPLSPPDVAKRSKGCFNLPVGERNAMETTTTMSSVDCFRKCQHQRYPLAVYRQQRGCWCGRVTDSNFKLKTCNSTHTEVEVFRTMVEDERCGNVQLLPPAKHKKTLLISYPGSGNTWIRYLLEKTTGFYTGSMYNDQSLLTTGYLGETIPVGKNRTDLIKSHILFDSLAELQKTSATILVIRNPYRAIVSYFNYDMSTGDKHVGHVEAAALKRALSEQVVKNHLADWQRVAKYALKSGKPYLILYYEDIVADPIFNLRKIIKFLPNVLLHPTNLEERLACLSQDTTGFAKRKPSKVLNNPYTLAARQAMNMSIAGMRKMLLGAGVKKELPPYEKDPDYAS